MLSGRGLCDWPITRPEESYRLWCDIDCDRESSIMKMRCPTGTVAPWLNNNSHGYSKCQLG